MMDWAEESENELRNMINGCYTLDCADEIFVKPKVEEILALTKETRIKME